MLNDPAFFALIGLIIFLGIIAYYGGFKAIFSHLDARSEQIKVSLKDAKDTRDEAISLLAEAQAKVENLEKEIAEIKSASYLTQNRIIDQMISKNEKLIESRTKSAVARIKTEQQKASAQLAQNALDMAISGAHKYLADNPPSSSSDIVIDNALKAMQSIKKVQN